jgi:RHS repeat-associated protein
MAVDDPNSHTTEYLNDYANQTVSTIDALGHTQLSTYSSDRLPAQLTNALTQITTLTYDTTTNNLLQITANPSASGQTPVSEYLSYNTGGTISGGTFLASSVTDGNTKCASVTYDTAGNPTDIDSGLTPSGSPLNCDGGTGGTVVANAYKGDSGTTGCTGQTGELCTTTSGLSNVTTYGYNTAGELTSITQPAGSCTGTRKLCTTYTYESNNSRPHSVTDGKNQTTTYTYDNDDRVTQILYNGTTSCVHTSGNCVTLGYDVDGNLTTRTDATGTTTLVYDDLNRLTNEELPSGANACSGSSPAAIVYGYDAASNLTSYCDAGGTINYAYDAANRTVGVATGTGSCALGSITQPCTQYGYDNGNELKTITYPTTTGVVETLGYNFAGDRTSAEVTDGAATIDNLTYAFTSGTTDKPLIQSVLNNITTVTTSYGYTALEQLTSASTGTGSTSQSYTYDKDGNLTIEDLGGTTHTMAYNSADQLCWAFVGTSTNACASAPTGSNTYTYDADGNQTASSGGLALSYNPINQATSMTNLSGGSATSMTYTGINSALRTAAGSTTFTNNTFGAATSTTSGTTLYFTRDPDGSLNSLLDGSSRYYYLYDGTGNIIGLVNSTGTQEATYTYDPYGTTTSSGTLAATNPYQYKGGYTDPTGYIKFGTRYYNAAHATWTQQDPESNTPNYTYAGDNPINDSDPSGLCGIWSCLTGAAATIAGVATSAYAVVSGSQALALFASAAESGDLIELLAGGLALGPVALAGLGAVALGVGAYEAFQS